MLVPIVIGTIFSGLRFFTLFLSVVKRELGVSSTGIAMIALVLFFTACQSGETDAPLGSIEDPEVRRIVASRLTGDDVPSMF